MRAEGFAAFIAIEQGRENPKRQSRGDKERVALQSCHDHVAQLVCLRTIFWQLTIVLDRRGLVTGGHPAVDPVRAIHHFAAMRDLLRVKETGNLDDHGLWEPLKT